jgi:hypothetical protein
MHLQLVILGNTLCGEELDAGVGLGPSYHPAQTQSPNGVLPELMLNVSDYPTPGMRRVVEPLPALLL